tara:strand:- start:11 stop:457 length:447 start_codon:yes stop_codon:yes gene_type:complete
MAESELIKQSRKAAIARTDKMYEKNKEKIASLKKDYKEADFTEDDYIKGRDSAITGITKGIKEVFSPKSKKQRVHRKIVELKNKNKRLSDFQDSLKDAKVVKQTKEFVKTIPEAMGGYKSGGRAMYKSGMKVCKLARRGKGRAYGKNS